MKDTVDAFFARFMEKRASRRGGSLRYDGAKRREFVRDLFDEGGVGALLAACDRLEERGLGWHADARYLLYNDVAQFVALRPGIEFARACLTLLQRPRTLTLPYDDEHARRTHERIVDLAMFQPLAVFETALAEDSEGRYADLFAHWIQELVVGGIRLDRHAEIARYWRALRHPLARLPLFLYDWEEGLGDQVMRPQHLEKEWPISRSWGPPIALAAAPPPTTVETEPLPSTMRAEAVVDLRGSLVPCNVPASWTRLILSDVEGCWSVESGSLAPTREVIARAWADLVLRANNPRVRALKSERAVRALKALPASGALRYLFRTIAYGGPFYRGGFGAGARLRAWTMLGDACGAEPDASLERVASAAIECQWATFHVAGFHAMEGWDFGIACVRADGRTLLLKAGTAMD